MLPNPWFPFLRSTDRSSRFRRSWSLNSLPDRTSWLCYGDTSANWLPSFFLSLRSHVGHAVNSTKNVFQPTNGGHTHPPPSYPTLQCRPPTTHPSPQPPRQQSTPPATDPPT